MILKEKPQKPIIIVGFPGFGLVGSIATEFLIEHLKTREIGTVIVDDMPATIAIHNNKMMNPIGIYYNEEKNIVIIHGIVPISGIEWKIADKLKNIFSELNPYRIINLEGVGTSTEEEKTYFFSNNEEIGNEIAEKGIEKLNNGIIVGITSSILVKSSEYPILNLFTSTHSAMPDSKASAKLIEELDKILGLHIDPQPLIEQAQKFEDKLKTILKEGKRVKDTADKKTLSYLG